MGPKPLTLNFWDVGQGDCSSIRFPNGELIVIDVGPRSSPLYHWLHDNPGVVIDQVIITHNDADHCGGLNAILGAFHARIRHVRFLRDRPVKALLKLPMLQTMLRLRSDGLLSVSRLECDAQPRILWQDASIPDLWLELLFPDFLDNLSSPSPNTASAIIRLCYDYVPLCVWPGDSPIARVAEIAAIPAPNVLMGPHHGAPVDRKRASFVGNVGLLSPQTCFISVGSGNSYGHPSVPYIRGLSQRGCRVVCSQLTPKCKLRRADKHAGFDGTAFYGLPTPAGSKRMACHGHMRLTFENGELTDELQDRHQAAVEQLVRPWCHWDARIARETR